MSSGAGRALVGIAGPRWDDEVLALARALRARDARVRVVDFTGLPAAHVLELRCSEPVYDGRSLRELEVLFIRRFRYAEDERPLARAAEGDERAWEESVRRWQATRRDEAEVFALVWSALSLLPCPLVNSLEAQRVHPRKVHQLRTLAAAGVPVPPFLATNDAETVRTFARAQPEGAVLKPLRGFLKTERLRPETPLPLSHRPVLAQRFVPGETVRVYAVAGRPVAAAVMRNAGHVDSSVGPTAIEPVALDRDEEATVRRAARAAGLPWTGIDLQRPFGRGPSQVLECNASPMFANFERRTGADVAGPLADHLLQRARGGPEWEDDP